MNNMKKHIKIFERKIKMRGPKTPIKINLSEDEKTKLTKLSKGLKTAHSIVIRSLIILYLYMGFNITGVSKKLDISRSVVRKWATRYCIYGTEGLKDASRSGKPPKFGYDIALHIIKIACEMPDKLGRSLALWDCKEIAKELMRTKVVEFISQETVRRILEGQKLKPWRYHMWLSEKEKKPRDKVFCDSVREVTDLYFRSLKSNECVLCFDENTSLQARKRKAETKAAIPEKPVLVEHEYERKGALNLFAAFDTRTGKVYGQCYRRKRQIECIMFFEYLDKTIPKVKTIIHIICDNCSTHHGKEVRKWLKQHPRFQAHYTPVHCSWMNQVEQWFGILKRKRLVISNFQSIDDLEEKLYLFIEQWNEEAHAFKWTDKTRAKLERFVARIEERLASKDEPKSRSA